MSGSNRASMFVGGWFKRLMLAAALAVALAPAGALHAESPYPNVIESVQGKVHPAPGYKWLNSTEGDFRVVWEKGQSHPVYPHVVSGTKQDTFVAAPGYRFANDLPNDMSVVRITTSASTAVPSYGVGRRPSDEQVGRAIAKIVGAVVAHAASQPEEEDDFLTIVLKKGLQAGRDGLVESAIKEVYPQLSARELMAVRRTICLSLDGQLNEAQWARSTARDELISALQGSNPDAAAAVQIADFVGQVVEANSR
jgi:hypothetical protein